MFFRDNIDIDLDIENEILENIDIDIEPQFDIVPPLKQSMQPCTEMLLHCKWMNREVKCPRIFQVVTTDEGFCCVFNSVNQRHLMKAEV